MIAVIRREAIYLWYYFDIQLRQILPYWALGIVIGSVISVFGKDKIHKMLTVIQDKHLGIAGIVSAALLGIASPLCMYGTIPIAASFSQKGLRDDYLAAFMMCSVLLNPQLLIYSAALGRAALIIRFVSCFLCGITAGVLVRIFYKDKKFFNFTKFDVRKSRDTDPNMFMRLLKNIGRNIKATGPWFLIGVILSALFQRYVPAESFAGLFNNRGFGLLMVATIGVPLYVCGGGTIPLLQQWLASGMSMGAAASFMITGPSTKITNLGALKIVLGAKHFAIYIAFVIIFALAAGAVVNLII
ncbi:MAG: permease [Clostridia bacterium]|nr:permease [Clostridia bacterium]